MDQVGQASGASAQPALSVVIGTTQPWPTSKAVLDSVYEQAQSLGAELILGVREASGAPPADAYPFLETFEVPGASVFELRESGIARSSGAIVALTEDHCVVSQDWCRRVLEAHERFPDADVIGGAVANGACDPIGWASFMISNGPFLPPLQTRERAIVTGHANVSFKRRALRGWGAGGLDDGRFRRELLRCGGQLVTDGRIEVLHDQWFPPISMCIYQFHGGRALAGSQRAHLTGWPWLRRLIKVLLLPVRVAVNAPRLALGAGLKNSAYWTPMLRCQPWMGALLSCVYLGELIGHLTGPGRSPQQLR